MGDLGSEQQPQRIAGRTAPIAADDAGVVAERRLDVEADPVEERQHGGEPFRVDAGGVERGGETQGANLSERGGEAALQARRR